MTSIRERALAHPAGQRAKALKAEAAFLGGIAAGREHWPGMHKPFNGQQARLRAIRRMVELFEPDAFVETGTFIGSSTRFFCGQGVPVYTAELKRSFWFVSRLRLGLGSDAEVIHADSQHMLRELANRNSFMRPFVYLDAHWWGEIPVATELTIITERWSDALIVIDDFRVDDDPGYSFDSFDGVDLALANVDLPDECLAAYPNTPSGDETGARRGTLYVAHGTAARGVLSTLKDDGALRAADSTSST